MTEIESRPFPDSAEQLASLRAEYVEKYGEQQAFVNGVLARPTYLMLAMDDRATRRHKRLATAVDDEVRWRVNAWHLKTEMWCAWFERATRPNPTSMPGSLDMVTVGDAMHAAMRKARPELDGRG